MITYLININIIIKFKINVIINNNLKDIKCDY